MAFPRASGPRKPLRALQSSLGTMKYWLWTLAAYAALCGCIALAQRITGDYI